MNLAVFHWNFIILTGIFLKKNVQKTISTVTNISLIKIQSFLVAKNKEKTINSNTF